MNLEKQHEPNDPAGLQRLMKILQKLKLFPLFLIMSILVELP